VPHRRIRVLPTAEVLQPALDAIRQEFEVPGDFPADVLAEAAAVAARGPSLPTASDRRDLPLVSIDPPGSRDLDQAYFAERRTGGYRVWYAIADVAAFVAPGGALDREARRRGVTLYLPDHRTPLHPDTLGEGAASLLPGEDRQALLWRIDLDGDGMPVGDASLERATVRNRAALSYPEVQASLDGGTADEPLVLLREIGRLREAREVDRGGVSLRLPTQEVVVRDGRADLAYDAPFPVEGWNAEISLLAGIVAAGMMLDGHVGILRTLPPPDEQGLDGLRHSAAALGVAWPSTMRYPDFVRRLDPATPVGAALLQRAARTLRGAGYTSFDGPSPDQPAHAAVASTYAHVTAPLRRLVDRFANEIVVSLCAGERPPGWVLDALDEVPKDMAAATRKEHEVERAVVDAVEALLLVHHVGETFDGAVVADDGKGHRSVQITDPAVVGALDGGAPAVELGERVRVRLAEADPAQRRVRFTPAPGR
jgi:exoribonuclease R